MRLPNLTCPQSLQDKGFGIGILKNNLLWNTFGAGVLSLAFFAFQVSAQTPLVKDGPKPALPETAAKLESLSTEELINRLTRETQTGPGYQVVPPPENKQVPDGLPAIPEFMAQEEAPATKLILNPMAKSGEVKKAPLSPLMRELVKRGTQSLPLLLAHLDDKRPTGIVLKGNNLSSPIIMSNEYPPRDLHPDRRPKGTVSSFFEAAAVQGVPGVEPFDETKIRYTIKVGDLCYVLVGQIVNRPYHAARYQPTAITIVNSPVHVPSLAQACRQEWSGLTPELHRQSLLKDCNHPPTSLVALKRLLVYYRPTGEEQLVRFLKRPFYDLAKVDAFIDEVVASLSNMPQKQIDTLESTKDYVTLISEFQNRFNYLVSFYAPFEVDRFGSLFKLNLIEPVSFNQAIVKKILVQPLPGNYRQLVSEFQKENGEVGLKVLPLRIYQRFHEGSDLGDFQFAAKKYKSEEFLKAVYPQFDPFDPQFIDGVTVPAQRDFVFNFGPTTTASVDQSLLAVFQSVSGAPNLLTSPNPEKHELARACIVRLAGKGHDGEFRNYLEKQIKDIQTNYNDQYRRIEKEEFALLEKLRK